MLFSKGVKPARRSKRGHMAVITGLAAIPLAMIVVVTIELVSLSSERARMQAAVDAAALAGARELAVAGGSARNAEGFAETFAHNQVADLTPRIEMSFIASKNANGGFQVSGLGVRGSFFGNMVPPGGFRIQVTAVAEALNQQPLCILTLPENDDDGGALMGLSGLANSSVSANNCLVHSNGDMQTRANATITAGIIQASRTVTGRGFAPVGNNGALSVPDPFLARAISRPSACAGNLILPFIVAGNLTATLSAGVHRRRVMVLGNGKLILGPGDHYFCDDLIVTGNGALTGDDVVLIFDEETLHASQNASISLTGRRSGDWAGFVIVSTRENDEEMEISSSRVDKLLGTIYLPNASLDINAAGAVAEDSKWSVIVAKNVKLDLNARLVINTDYIGSGVPVPNGVGDKSSNNKTRLRQ